MAPGPRIAYLPDMSYPENHDTPPVPPQDWADETEARLLDAAVRRVADHGRWDARLVDLAAADIGLSRAECELLLPYGPKDLAALLARRHDAITEARLAELDPAGLRIRERITIAVQTRIAVAMEDEAAVRRSLGFLALPGNAPLAGRLMWAAADQLWRWAGDTATDFNHYSKRAILSTVLASTLAVRLARDEAAADTHLAARIEGVMAFEKAKAGIKLDPEGAARSVAGLLARLRYGRPVSPEAPPSAG
jgi:ubiquinone biosynthesis protein COQ9